MSTFIARALGAFLTAVLIGNAFAAEPAQPPVAVRWWGQAYVTIESWWGLDIAIDPYRLDIGYSNPNVSAGLVLITHNHGDHSNADLVSGSPEVVKGLDDAGVVKPIDVVLDRRPNEEEPSFAPFDTDRTYSPHAVRMGSIATDHDDVGGSKRGKNAMFLIEVDGVRILHCGDLGQTAFTEDQRKQIGALDVLIIPVGGVYTIDGPQAAKLVTDLAPRFIVPIHYKTDKLSINLNGLQPFLDALPDSITQSESVGNTLAVAANHRSDEFPVPTVVKLKFEPWQMPEELAELFRAKEQASRAGQTVYESLTIEQLNHRPSDGTHTPRWNAEHVMGRELGFFTAIYNNRNAQVPHMDLNPQQMPPDYVAAHSDWTGAEEARQLERVLTLTRRFAYLLDGIALDDRPQGSPWSLRGLLAQMEQHCREHTENVIKKFSLPDWPAGEE